MSHTTHFACKEVLERDGGKAIGCCCTGHKCKTDEEIARQDIEDAYYEYSTVEQDEDEEGRIGHYPRRLPIH